MRRYVASTLTGVFDIDATQPVIMPTIVSISLLIRFMAFYVTGHPSSFFLSTGAPRHRLSVAVSSAHPTHTQMSSPLQITVEHQRLISFAAFGPFAKPSSTSSYWLTTPEFTHTHHDLFPIAKWKDVLERVRLAGGKPRHMHSKPLHLQWMLQKKHRLVTPLQMIS
jgi:hypothetical protein